MKDLKISHDQQEYSRIMAHRIKYFAEKYDPHTIFFSPIEEEIPKEHPPSEKRPGFSMVLKAIFLNIF